MVWGTNVTIISVPDTCTLKIQAIMEISNDLLEAGPVLYIVIFTFGLEFLLRIPEPRTGHCSRGKDVLLFLCSQLVLTLYKLSYLQEQCVFCGGNP